MNRIRHSVFLAAVAASVLLAPSVRADEVRLHDGRVYVGAVHKSGEDRLEIRTRDGTVTVARAEVLAIRTDAELRAALGELAGAVEDSAHSRLRLAETALSYGLTAEMWQHLDACLARLDGGDEKASSVVERQACRFMAKLEPELLPEAVRQKDTRARVRALIRQVRSGITPARRAAVLELLCREQDGDEPLREQAFMGLLDEQRLTALAALQRREGEVNALSVYRATILDDAATVRRGAAELIAAAGDAAEAVRYLIPGLLNDAPVVRMRTAEAYANLGDASAVPLLVMAGPIAGTPAAALAGGGGPGVRAHMYSLTERAYIRDFDVEIAQAAAVANPVIGKVQNGVVLDVNVPAVITETVPIRTSYRRALRSLVGDDPGADPSTWRTWLGRRDPALASQVPALAATGR